MPGGSRNPLVVGRVIGEVIDPFEISIPFRVTYGNREVGNGCELKPSQVANQPRVSVGGDDLRNFYTMVLVDPDAPSPSNPNFREYLHWLVTDIPETTGPNFGNEVVSYESPRPTMGIHRLVFVLFRQQFRQRVYAPGWRQNFNTREFAELYNLGLPVAAVFFNCQRESGSGEIFVTLVTTLMNVKLMRHTSNMARENPLVIGGVIGDVLNPFTISVSFTISINNRAISNGLELRPSQVVNRPRVTVGGEDLRTFYTLVMVDADAPSPSNPVLREYLHWMVTDIPATTNASFGREVVFYESPNPSAGIHRLVFILFQQLGRDTVITPEWRHNFNSRNFAEINNLAPVAAAYANCQRERGCGGRRY
ncbi:Protein FLOWERING LOCUS T [Glycine soja]